MARAVLCALIVGVAIGFFSATTTSGEGPPPTEIVAPPVLPIAVQQDLPRQRLTLEEIFKLKGTDKNHRHGYFRFYDPMFRALQESPITLLELGADHGASINSWSTYFFHSETKIFGLAYGVVPSKHPHDPRVKILSGDQNNCSLLRSIVQEIGRPIDIIIDDGSHHPDHQLRSFLALFPALPPGGLYVIEDIETSYWDAPGASVYGYRLDGVGVGSTISMVERAKLLVEVVNQRYMTQSFTPDFAFYSTSVDPLIESIMFAQNIVVFRRKVNVQFDRPLDNMADEHKYEAYRSSARTNEILRKARECLCK